MTSHLLVCGLGSIGRRHLRHFRALGVTRIDAFRTGKATLPDAGQPQPDRVFGDLDEALAERPQLVVVANPTSLHLTTALKAVQASCSVLIEKPLSHSLDGCLALADEVSKRGVVVSVACNLRFHPMLRRLHAFVRSREPLGTALMARAHFGAFLPDWHPWEDYRTSYAARRELGGGAALTHIHEIDMLQWLFGAMPHAHGRAMPAHPLGTDVDETSAFVMEHQSGVLSTATLSLAQKPASRNLEIVFDKGTALLDLLSGRLLLRFADGRVEEHAPAADFELDHTYRDQAQAFLDAARSNGKPTVTLQEAYSALRVALSIQGTTT